MENQTEVTAQTTTVMLNDSNDVAYIVVDDAALFEQIEQVEKYQIQQLEQLQEEIEIQQNLYTVTSYLLAAVIGFALIKLFSNFFNSVITF